MSLTIIKEPFEISLSNNPIIYGFKSNALYNGMFIYPYIEIYFLQMPNDGYSFSFEFIDPSTGSYNQIRFTARNNIDSSGTEFTRLNSQPNNQWLYSILEEFKNNQQLITYYSVEIVNSKIRFTSKKGEEKYIPTFFTQNTSGIISDTILTVAESPEKIKDLKINIEVYFEDDYLSNHWKLVSENASIPDTNGIAYFDISSIVHSACKNGYSNNPPIPILQTSAEFYKADLTRRFYIRYSESTDYNNGNFIAIKNKLVHFGGVSQEDFTKGNFFLFLQSGGKFNNWLEDHKTLLPEQPNYLNWTNCTNEDIEIDFAMKIYYSDGSILAYYPLVDTIEVKKWETVTIPTGYEQLDIATYGSSSLTVIKWEVWVTDSYSIQISEKKTFYLDGNHYECKNYLLFLNSLNTPEVIHTVGSWKKSISISRQFVTKSLEPNYKLINGQTFQYDNHSRNVFTVKTGYLSKNEIEILQDLLIGSSVFLLEKENYVPITIDGNSYDIQECLTFLNVLEFNVKKSFALKQYSKVSNQITLEAIEDCGIEGFYLNRNNLTVSNIQSLKLLDENSVQISATNFIYSTSKFTFANKLTISGSYYLELQATVNGAIVNYKIPYHYKNQEFSYQVETQGISTLHLSSTTPTPVYVDWGDGSAIEIFNITNPATAIAHNFVNSGVKKITIETPCNSLFSQVFNYLDNTISKLEY